MADLTLNQLKAVQHEGQNILVSAGAGSGKTTVLSLRVLRKLQDGIHIDQLMIVTYTNAAAAEMKYRIRQQIEEHVLTAPHLRDELTRLDNAMIATFDSFALQVVKEYHYLLGLPSTISIANAAQLTLIKETVLNDLFEELYEHPTDVFKQVLDIYFDKGDNALKQGVMTVYRSALMKPDKDAFFKSIVETQYSTNSINELLKRFNKIIFDKMEDLNVLITETITLYRQLADEEPGLDLTKTITKLESLLRTVSSIIDYDDYMIAYQSDQIKSSSSPKKVSQLESPLGQKVSQYHDAIGASIKSLATELDNIFGSDSQTLKENYISTKLVSSFMVNTAYTLYQRIRKVQLENNLYDFNDIMDLAIAILEQNESVRESFRSRYQEIMVDEYQDTNDLQNYLLSLIAKTNNMFLVGDVKQSIYGFRNANPSHFVAKMDDYSRREDSLVIALKENFRSRLSILDPINKMFLQLMDKTIGGVTYDQSQQLVFGQNEYLSAPLPEKAYAPRIAIYPFENRSGDYVQEAHWIAHDIKQRINQQMPTMVKKHFEPVNVNQFAILIDRKSGFTIFAEVFKKWGIPIKIYADESYVESNEIGVLLNFMKLVIGLSNTEYFNQYFNYAFYGLARSFIYQIKDDDIINWVLNRPDMTVDMIQAIDEHSAIGKMIQDIKMMSQLAQQLPLTDWLLKLLEITHFNDAILSLDNVRVIEAKLDFFIAQSIAIPNLSLKDYADLLIGVDGHDKIDLEFSISPSKQESGVTLMTIHRSKGLEFNHVYYPGISRQFTFNENKSKFISAPWGVLVKPFDNGFYRTFAHVVFNHEARQTMISERLRLWYVALTRARETMTFVMPIKSYSHPIIRRNANGVLTNVLRQKWNHFTDLINCTEEWREYDAHLEVPKMVESSSISSSETMQAGTEIQSVDLHQDAIIYEKKSYSKHEGDTLIDPSLLLAGNYFHEQLEHLDFTSSDVLHGLQEPLLSSVKALIETSPFKKRANSKFYHEYPFIDELGTKGVIDLIIETEDELFIIDFKLRNIDDPSYNAQVNGYVAYLSTLTTKPVSGFLYSLLKKEIIRT